MKRTFVSFPIQNLESTRQQMLNWIKQFSICCFLDNHQYSSRYPGYEMLAGAGVLQQAQHNSNDPFYSLKEFSQRGNDWLFGHFSFEMSRYTLNLSQPFPPVTIPFPDAFFFIPEYVILISADSISIGSMQEDHEQTWLAIQAAHQAEHMVSKVHIKPVIEKENYLGIIQKLKQHILRGDCYEINYCQEFLSENAEISPLQIYSGLSAASPVPFSACYRLEDNYLLCASPERYLRNSGGQLLSQPIKGTISRVTENAVADKLNRELLATDGKERSENVMIVDLVRNDLSRVSQEGSVQVEELFGVYSFPQVHQMVSSVTGEAKPGLHWTDIIRNTFPMGSMTGAPKKRVLELISAYELSGRGIYSGTVGYVTPEGDFDFNVVIRSIVYNSRKKLLNYHVGSAITFASDPEKEYEECLLKASAIKKVLAD